MRAAQSPRPRVILADADPIAGGLLAQMLHLAGFDCLQAATGERALLLLREHRDGIDCLVTASDLPGLVDRAILADEFQCQRPGQPIIVLTQADRVRDTQGLSIEVARSAPEAVVALLGRLSRPAQAQTAQALAA